MRQTVGKVLAETTSCVNIGHPWSGIITKFIRMRIKIQILKGEVTPKFLLAFIGWFNSSNHQGNHCLLFISFPSCSWELVFECRIQLGFMENMFVKNEEILLYGVTEIRINIRRNREDGIFPLARHAALNSLCSR